MDKRSIKDVYFSQFWQQEKMVGIAVCLISCARDFLKKWSCHLKLDFSQSFHHQFKKTQCLSCSKFSEFVYTPPLVWFWPIFVGFMTRRVQKNMFWDTSKNAKSVILHFFSVAEMGRNIHLLYFYHPQEIYSQFVEWGKKCLFFSFAFADCQETPCT